jgi:hypothetical protein
VPGNLFFLAIVVLMTLSAVVFVGSLNLVLQRLGAMLPDETLRLETRQFTLLNLNLLALVLLLLLFYLGLSQVRSAPLWLSAIAVQSELFGPWFIILLSLLPLAMTMALLWKTKEVILDSVFGGDA